LEQVDVPLPEKIVQAQVDDALHNAIHGLDHDEAKFDETLQEQGRSREEFDADSRSNAERSIKTQLLMDAFADDLNIQVGQNDITERLVLMSRQYGVEPQQLIQLLQQNNQLPAMYADVRRGLTVAAIVEAATITDTDGNVVDTSEFFGPPADDQADATEAAADDIAPPDTEATESVTDDTAATDDTTATAAGDDDAQDTDDK
jgi:trigger factor